MIIKRVKLNPFGASANREFVFEEGLNIILGPNEAGKSTLINAIFAGLFIPSNPRKNSDDWAGFLANYLPYPNGDTARVELELLADNNDIQRYLCAWGAGREERLIYEDGQEIRDAGTVQSKLAEIMHYGRGTYQAVLFARQEEMNQTIKMIRENKEAGETIAGLLRAALFESGGVSLDKLADAIEKEHEDLLSNWDWDTDGPRGGKGLANPHKMKKGLVLQAFYDYETIRRNLRNIQTDEIRISDLNQRIEELTAQQKEMNSKLFRYGKLEGDVWQRLKLEPQLNSVRLEEKQLKVIVDEWPRAEERVKNIAEAVRAKKVTQAKLENELKDAEAELKARSTRELFSKVEVLNNELISQSEELEKMQKIDSSDTEYLEQLEKKEMENKAVARAMKLKAEVTVKKPLELTVTSGMEKPVKMTISEQEILEGDGRFLFESDSWSIGIQSGQEDVDTLIEEALNSRELIDAKLRELAVADLSAAKALLNKRIEAERSLENAKTRINDLLGEWTYDTLKAFVQELGDDKSVRDPELIGAEQKELNQLIANENASLNSEEQKIAGWLKEHGSTEQVFSAMAELKSRLNDINRDLSKLASIPEEYESADQFIEKLKEMRSLKDSTKDELVGLKEELSKAQSRMPDASTEDLEIELKLAQDKLANLKNNAAAVIRVKKEFGTLKNELDTDTFTPLIEKFNTYLTLATANQYTLAEMGGSIPDAIVSSSGKKLPVELLSAGTTNGLAIALRLTLADYILQDRNGFMVMDDPLLHLDPERRKSVAKLINQFAEAKQIIITTCDPQTAQLLGGNLINM